MVKAKKKMKEVCFEFPPWDHVEYKNKIEKYFKTVRKLNNKKV
jgi:hypothetical protein